MRKLLSFSEFGDKVLVARLGLRAKFVAAFDGTFEDLAARFGSRYLSITERARRAVGDDATLVDIGAPLNFKDGLGSFNTVSGPMRQVEFPRFFTRDE
ncbi:MAG: hypothetical protein M3O61_12095, partial [Gemmatimonadota bacterium]|nr:hypothetical protein [Gemmatimonadota bacterium]